MSENTEKKRESKYSCINCDFYTDDKSKYNIHLLTRKHKRYEISEKIIEYKYSCTICDYFTSEKCNYEKHLLTDKHSRMNLVKKTGKKYICVNCNFF